MGHLHLQSYTRAHMYMYKHAHVHTYMYKHAHVHTYMYKHHAHTCTSMHMCTHAVQACTCILCAHNRYIALVTAIGQALKRSSSPHLRPLTKLPLKVSHVEVTCTHNHPTWYCVQSLQSLCYQYNQPLQLCRYSLNLIHICTPQVLLLQD